MTKPLRDLLRAVPVRPNPYADNLRAELAVRDPAALARWELIEAQNLVERARLIDLTSARSEAATRAARLEWPAPTQLPDNWPNEPRKVNATAASKRKETE